MKQIFIRLLSSIIMLAASPSVAQVTNATPEDQRDYGSAATASDCATSDGTNTADCNRSDAWRKAHHMHRRHVMQNNSGITTPMGAILETPTTGMVTTGRTHADPQHE